MNGRVGCSLLLLLLAGASMIFGTISIVYSMSYLSPTLSSQYYKELEMTVGIASLFVALLLGAIAWFLLCRSR